MQKGAFFAPYLTFLLLFNLYACFMLGACLLAKSVKSRIFYCSKLVIIEQTFTTPW